MNVDSSERSWLEQGRKVGDNVVPLARTFNGTDIESGSTSTVREFREKQFLPCFISLDLS